MHKLTHFRLCPRSRSIRIALAELGIAADAVEEHPWKLRPQFLALNPAGELPVLEIEGGPILCGAYVAAEYIAETSGTQNGGGLTLIPGDSEERAEVRRLFDWFHGKLDREVTREILHEKVYARLTPKGQHSPSAEILRAAHANLRYHLSYINFLVHQRTWLAGEELSFADLAAAGHLSSLDYLAEVPWEDYPVAKLWYARIKSRPAFRQILADRLPGPPPPPAYTDLDF